MGKGVSDGNGAILEPKCEDFQTQKQHEHHSWGHTCGPLLDRVLPGLTEHRPKPSSTFLYHVFHPEHAVEERFLHFSYHKSSFPNQLLTALPQGEGLS